MSISQVALAEPESFYDLLFGSKDGLKNLFERGQTMLETVFRELKTVVGCAVVGIEIKKRFERVADRAAFYIVRTMASYMDEDRSDHILRRFIGPDVTVEFMQQLNNREHKGEIKKLGKLIRTKIENGDAIEIAQFFGDLLRGCWDAFLMKLVR